MKLISRIFAIALFLLFFGFALKNTDEAVLHFFLGYEIRSPLVLLLLAFFAAGAIFGVLAMTPTVFRYRRELDRQKKAFALAQQESAQRVEERTPAPDGVIIRDTRPS